MSSAGRADSVPDRVTYGAAGGVVVLKDCRVLVLDRPSRGEIRLPKGHVEPGEDFRSAAVRETIEETGYGDVAIEADLGEMTVEFEWNGRTVVRDERYFLMRLASPARVGRPRKDAAQFRVLWLAPRDAVGRLTYGVEREWVRRALARRRTGPPAPRR